MSVTELLKDIEKPPKGTIVVVPFATQPLMEWLGRDHIILGYSSDPYTTTIFKKDCLLSPPRLSGAYVICYPPWDRKNDASDKSIFDSYGTDNLYKCFLKNLINDSQALGGTIIIPLNFLTGSRDSEKKRRKDFLNSYKIKKLHVYNEITINTYTPIVLSFIRRTEPKPTVEMFMPVFYPSRTQLTWLFDTSTPMLPGSDPFKYTPYTSTPNNQIKIKTTLLETEDVDDSQHMYVCKFESSTRKIAAQDNAVSADYRISIQGHMSKRLQRRLMNDFNKWVGDWIELTNGIFLNYTTTNNIKTPYISTDLVTEAMKRILWSYYQKPDTASPLCREVPKLSTPL
jgi:hypothetical protein